VRSLERASRARSRTRELRVEADCFLMHDSHPQCPFHDTITDPPFLAAHIPVSDKIQRQFTKLLSRRWLAPAGSLGVSFGRANTPLPSYGGRQFASPAHSAQECVIATRHRSLTLTLCPVEQLPSLTIVVSLATCVAHSAA